MLGAGAAGRAAHPGIVAQTSLFARLSAAVERGVMLISAPAGSGKTVLLRSWIAAANLGDRTAWVSLDPGEHDAQRFWLQVVEALRLVPAAAALVDRRTATPEFNGQAFVDRLIDELAELDQPGDARDRRPARAGLDAGSGPARAPPGRPAPGTSRSFSRPATTLGSGSIDFA